MSETTKYKYAPTPVEAADHIDEWQRRKDAGEVGLPGWPVELMTASSGEWERWYGCAMSTRTLANPLVACPNLRLVLMPALPVTERVHLDELPGRTLVGETEAVVGYGSDPVRGLEWTPKDGLGRGVSPDDWYRLTVGSDHMVEVLVPEPVETVPGTVTVRLPRDAAEHYATLVAATNFTGAVHRACRAALDAGDEG